ncbi:hypothetical protein B0G81_8201 [Paraburkholderia sp. BL6665CI2N2]|uniref:hypothetical protein n=1 Tax=Paraburkholderia sp. BL6665CI2N2 TaxID=1938806 RepID=UPI0010666F0B|nr:hypothetical protein [Paraburkholderia sp. BL6665CI2N2]TDY17030.1 hypothetical protein B0G81_8201 [Paraburkholderia sp. BL6665CI2N2]
MTQPLDFGLLGFAELLTYLVVPQLQRHHATGRWLRVEHLLEAARCWTRSNSGDIIWPQLTFTRGAQQLAEHVARILEMTFDAKTVASMFVDGVHLNFRSPAVTEIYLICAAQLQTH